jgi:hypothetical protein
LIADVTPLRRTGAAAEYAHRAAAGDALDIKARLRTCLRSTFVLEVERPGGDRPATVTLGELHAVDVALESS